MPPPDDLSSLRDIEHCATLVLRWTADMDSALFLQDELVESAVYRQLSIIGEAVGRLTGEFRAAHTEIDWRSWIDFRNILVHAYDTIDGERVWVVVRGEIAELRSTALALIDELLERPGHSVATD